MRSRLRLTFATFVISLLALVFAHSAAGITVAAKSIDRVNIHTIDCTNVIDTHRNQIDSTDIIKIDSKIIGDIDGAGAIGRTGADGTMIIADKIKSIAVNSIASTIVDIETAIDRPIDSKIDAKIERTISYNVRLNLNSRVDQPAFNAIDQLHRIHGPSSVTSDRADLSKPAEIILVNQFRKKSLGVI